MEYMTFTDKTKDEAITKACEKLGVPSYELDIQVVSEGSKGFFGIGNKPAIIKVAKKSEAEIEQALKEKAEREAEEKRRLEEERAAAERAKSEAAMYNASETSADDEYETRGEERRPRKKRDNRRRESGRFDFEEPVENKAPHVEEKREPIIKTEEEVAALKQSAENFLKEVFAAMDIPVGMSMEYEEETGSLAIELSGDDMGVLIGKRGQTLDSLQYLTSLVINKNQKEYIRVKLDTEDYRRRRKETLESLAKNIASKVKKTHRAVVLEPMNPYERRIIHSVLQPNRYVETYSDGSEPYRHVVVAPRRRRDYDED